MSPGTSFQVKEIPPDATELDVYGWDGCRKRIPLPPDHSSYTVTDLPTNETLIFLAGNGVLN